MVLITIVFMGFINMIKPFLLVFCSEVSQELVTVTLRHGSIDVVVEGQGRPCRVHNGNVVGISLGMVGKSLGKILGWN